MSASTLFTRLIRGCGRHTHRNTVLLSTVFLLLCFYTGSAVTETRPEGPDSSSNSGDSIQEKMRKFLNSHCNRRNQSLEQEEYETFIKCNPTQAAMIIRNIDSHQESDPSSRHLAIQAEIHKQCSDWPLKRSCQKKNFKLIEKCFDGQQKFVFYFLLALTDTICQDGDTFAEFWEKGGDQCLNDHLKSLTNEISECLTFTSTMTKEELDKNIDKITGCIGDKFSNCGSPASNQVIQNLLKDIESFYNEIKISAASTSSASRSTTWDGSTVTPGIVISLGLFSIVRGRVMMESMLLR